MISPTVSFLCSSSKEQKVASKRSMKEDTVENLAKKINLEQKKISEKINKDYPDMDITDHEINKSIWIFHTLLKTSLNDDKFLEILAVDIEDGVPDTISLIVTQNWSTF